jgi:hypothetical protein
MGDITISSLLGVNIKNQGSLNIKTLFTPPINLSTKILIDEHNKQEKQKYLIYQKIYYICCEKIKKENQKGFTETILFIPRNTYSLKSYDCYECLNVIIKKLIEQQYEILCIEDLVIKISWDKIIHSFCSNNNKLPLLQSHQL